MSCGIRLYKSMDLGGGHDDLHLNAFVGGDDGHCIQFTIGGKYCALSQEQLEDLIVTIKARIALMVGYTATGHERDNIEYSAEKGETK